MKSVSEEFGQTATTVEVPCRKPKNKSRRKSPSYKTTRDCPRVTVRLSIEDHARLKELADGMALSVYIRAKAVEEELPRRKSRSVSSVADQGYRMNSVLDLRK